MLLVAGARLGPYEVVSPLGAGGMGEVYRARHLKLGRDVAIKVLPSELSSDPDRLRRFEREARTTSALNHTNIVTIHDINEHDGTHYIAMELVQGRTLRELLIGAPLPVVHLLALARQIAEGLGKAHAAGIVHRDLKPENLMVTDDGLVKILDFGLAKLTPTSAEAGSELNTVEELTQAGVLLGTVSYMSPEQAAGRPVGFQSDQFSFGLILYEMATGRRAFRKETKPQTLAAIIETEPEPLGNATLPAAFIAIVQRCLAKDPEKRFASTRELAAALQAVPEGTSSVQTELQQARRPKHLPGAIFVVGALGLLLAGLGAWAWRARGAPASRVMLAVLPFENLGSDPEREYLADGLTDDTIASLGQIDPEHMSVIGRTSTMAYKGTRKSLATIGAELNVNYLVESSVRAEAGRLRVTAKLIRVRDQVQVWAETYDREPTSLLALQRELSTAVAEQIRLRLSPERLAALERRHTRNADAYDLYLRGRYLWYQLTPPTTRRAIEYYQQATRLDPDYALAWSGLADAYAGSPINGDAPPLDVWPRAREAVAEAVRVDPKLAEAQASLGLFKFWLDWDLPAAEAACRRSMTLDPGYSDAHRMLGIVLSHLGRHDEARTALRRARELDPLSAINQAFSASIEVSARDPSGAVPFARQAIVIDPQFWVGHFQLAQAYEQKGSTDLALEALSSAARLSNNNSKTLSLRGYLWAKAGKADAAREALALLVAVSRERYVPPYAMSLVHAGLGERDAVFGWLDKAYAVHDVHLLWLLSDPKWAPYRADPRFRALVARCGFTQTATTAASTP